MSELRERRITCPVCQGDGIQWRHAPHAVWKDEPGLRIEKHDCPRCIGKGVVPDTEAKDET